MPKYLIDFETRSLLNLEYTNAVKYAKHPSTRVLCMSIGESDDYEATKRLWYPGGGQVPYLAHTDPKSWELESFNAEFELAIWNHCCTRLYQWPSLEPTQITCLNAEASMAGFPRALDNLSAWVLALGEKGKDMEGHKIMMELTRPQNAKCNEDGIWVGGAFDESREKLERCGAYCLQDGSVEARVKQYVRPLGEFERKLWLAHVDINGRGVPVDVPMCQNIMWMARKERARLMMGLDKLTGGKLQKASQTKMLREWMNEQGVYVSNTRKEMLADLDKKSLPEDVQKVLRIRELVADAAIEKFQAMLCNADDDMRCRNQLIYYKAGTGRFQGGGVNFLNLRRLNDDEVPAQLEMAERISLCPQKDLVSLLVELQQTKLGVIPTLAKLVRLGVKAPKGRKLIVRDYSSIEMNMLHWLADDKVVLDRIASFYAGKGNEPYKIAAAQMYKTPYDEIDWESGTGKKWRKAGKVYYLGCGYVSGPAKLRGFALNYGIKMTEDEAAEMVKNYRLDNPKVVNLWHSYLRAAIKAVEYPGEHFEVGHIDFYVKGATLRFRLPSGRELCYYAPKIVKGRFGKEIECCALQDGRGVIGGRRWLSITTIIENIDQAASRDLLADALIRCRAENLPVVLHVYDEVIAEVAENDDNSINVLKQIMTDPPAWAKGLPIDVKGGESQRYTK